MFLVIVRYINQRLLTEPHHQAREPHPRPELSASALFPRPAHLLLLSFSALFIVEKHSPRLGIILKQYISFCCYAGLGRSLISEFIELEIPIQECWHFHGREFCSSFQNRFVSFCYSWHLHRLSSLQGNINAIASRLMDR